MAYAYLLSDFLYGGYRNSGIRCIWSCRHGAVYLDNVAIYTDRGYLDYSEVTLVSKKFCKVCYLGEKKIFVLFNSVTNRNELEKRINERFELAQASQPEQLDELY